MIFLQNVNAGYIYYLNYNWQDLMYRALSVMSQCQCHHSHLACRSVGVSVRLS